MGSLNHMQQSDSMIGFAMWVDLADVYMHVCMWAWLDEFVRVCGWGLIACESSRHTTFGDITK